MGGRIWIAVAGLLGAVGVGMAAYATHGLGFIEDSTLREAARATLQTAVQQQMFHALALPGVGALAQRAESRLLALAGLLFTVGVLLFSGLVYLRILGGVESLRMFVPWGGTCLIAGWLVLAAAGLGLRNRP
jgi:uncharacterized membrane protein YgdD (TMEM256/DUF423 family)